MRAYPQKSSLLGADASSAVDTLCKGLEQKCKSLDVERLYGRRAF